MTKNIDMIKNIYENFKNKVGEARKTVDRPLTYAEKILYAHLDKPASRELMRAKEYALLRPDRVAMQDATAQMALLQFINANKNQTAVPTTVHCDHLIIAEKGADDDLSRAKIENKEVYDFLESVSARYGIGFWKPGAGIIHQIVLENYAFPGGLMIGTDSHTPNAGGLGMVAIGVGGADAVDVMVGLPWELKWPKLIGVRLTGSLGPWAAPKDVILKLLGILTVKGGTGAIVEYFGEGCDSLSATGKATITNMGAELGATTSIFPYNHKTKAYLSVTGRDDLAKATENIADELRADTDVTIHPEKYFDQVITIDLSSVAPHLNGPFTPDKEWTVENIAEGLKENGYPQKLSSALIGSCTNSSYEDIDKAAKVARQALDNGIRAACPFYITPGSKLVRDTLERDGQLDTLIEFGGIILANACGPCIGQWHRLDNPMKTKNSIVTSYNRNFRKRADGNPETRAFVASPELVTAFAAAGRIDFDPRRDKLKNSDGEEVLLTPPLGKELPENFVADKDGLIEKGPDASTDVKVKPDSERLQLLTPFPAWNGNDLLDLPVLFKASGKCTTDHISAAGPWLKFRGHLDRISDNLLSGAANAFYNEAGRTLNPFNGRYEEVSRVAREYKKQNILWVIIGDENYGEGSSREHAAMEPRHLGGIAVIARSFARIHETNLKKQGMLALTFKDPADYDKIKEKDKISLVNLNDSLKPGHDIKAVITHDDGNSENIILSHTFGDAQIEWFKAGSALNLIAKL